MPSVITSLTTPLLIVTLGILFLVEYEGGPRVAQTWPILLVLGGVLLALRRRGGPGPESSVS